MKKVMVLMVLVAILFAGVAMAEERYAPTRHDRGTIGAESRYWRMGYFSTLANFKHGTASKSFDGATGEWVLNSSEQRAHLLYISSVGNTGTVIIAPSEIGRAYTLFNNSGQTVTIKKSGGVGIAVANGKVATVMYFASLASEDYMRITADQTF